MDNYQRNPQQGGNWPQKNSQNNNQPKKTPEEFLTQHPFDSKWITQSTDKSMVNFAEEAGKYMAKQKLTKSKIRSIYGEIKRIQINGFDKEKASFYLLRPKMAYALGRDSGNHGLKLFKLIFDKSSELVQNANQYENFCNLFEAILAYHKANGGKD
ncbi:MAG: type III-A CRISPR-associated protein Csm2 [Paludibacteraceae bacterium]|jgi:CRISPR-associated protein Csm2|nr:type III-A CRISPR-associated protein Csm2 [Paludibacteraceae bacterium]